MSEPAYPQPIQYDPVMMTQVMSDAAVAQQQAYIDGQKQLYKFQFKRAQTDVPILGDLRRSEEVEDRQALIDFLSQYGVETQQAMLASNPLLAQQLGYIDEMSQATHLTPEITAELDRQALEGIQGLGALSAEDMRMSDQASREAFAARGMVMSDPAMFTEVLNRDSMKRARLEDARGFAAGREAGNRQFAQSGTQIADATGAAMKVLGMPTGSAVGMGNTLGFIQGVNTPDPSSAMAAGLGYYGDIQGYNANMQTSMYNSYQNNQAALQAGHMQAGAYGSSASAAADSAMMSAGIGAAGAIAGGVAIAF